MSQQNKDIVDIVSGTIKAMYKLFFLQLALTVLSWAAIIVAISIKLMGIFPKLVLPIAIVGSIFGIFSLIVARIAKPTHLKVKYIKLIFDSQITNKHKESKNSE